MIFIINVQSLTKVFAFRMRVRWSYHTEETYDIPCKYFQDYLHKKKTNSIIFLYWHAEYSHFDIQR